MKLQAVISLGLLGSIPHAFGILQKRDGASLKTMNADDNSFVQWGETYVKMDLTETNLGYKAMLFEHFGSCFMPTAYASEHDSVYRFQTTIGTPEHCYNLCSVDVRCSFARYFSEENVCQFLEYSDTQLGNTNPNSMMINGRCDDSCFLKDTQYVGDNIGTREAIDGLHCHNLCIQETKCSLFSFDTTTKSCLFYAAGAEPNTAEHIVSGPGSKCNPDYVNFNFSQSPAECDKANPEFCDASCHIHDNKFINGYSTIPSSTQFTCHKACHDDENCMNWSFANGNCTLHDGQQSIRSTKHFKAISGPRIICGSGEPLGKTVYYVNATFNGTPYLELEGIENTVTCEALCKARRRCSGFSHYYNKGLCQLFDIDAGTPKTLPQYSSNISSIPDGSTHFKCSKYTQYSAFSSSPGQKSNLLQCIISARSNKDVVGYIFADNECRFLNSDPQSVAESTEPTDIGVYGSTQLCRESEEESSCYIDNQSINGELKRHEDDLGSPEACSAKCRELPWCIGTIWQKDMLRCHLLDIQITGTRRNNNDMYASRSCDTSCFDNDFEIVDGVVLETAKVSSAGFCQMLCNAKEQCVSFSYDTAKSTCTLHSVTGKISMAPGIVSGPRMFCNAPYNPIPENLKEPKDGFVDFTISGNNLNTSSNSSISKCGARCDANPECLAFTYSGNNRHCYLKAKYAGFKSSNPKHKDVSMFKKRNLDCFYKGSVSSAAKPLSTLQFNTLIECTSHCFYFTGCVGIEYDPLENTCKTFDIEGFHHATLDGNKIVNYASQCA